MRVLRAVGGRTVYGARESANLIPIFFLPLIRVKEPGPTIEKSKSFYSGQRSRGFHILHWSPFGRAGVSFAWDICPGRRGKWPPRMKTQREDVRRMRNIPTSILRALVAVVDLGSYTKAGQSLGVTQPAVSAQLKQLQELIGGELFDKSTSGVNVTELGKVVVNEARRLLAINDRLLQLGAHRSSKQVRIGFPADFGQTPLVAVLTEHRRRWPNQRFAVRNDNSDSLLRSLRLGELDLVVAFTEPDQIAEGGHQWIEEIVWVHGGNTNLDLARPIPLVAYYDTAELNRAMTSALTRAQLDWEMVFVAPGTLGVGAAVAAGIGVSATLRRFIPLDLKAFDNPLPSLRDLCCGVYLRESADRELLEPIADAIVESLRPNPMLAGDSRVSPRGTAMSAVVSEVKQGLGGRSREI